MALKLEKHKWYTQETNRTVMNFKENWTSDLGKDKKDDSELERQ